MSRTKRLILKFEGFRKLKTHQFVQLLCVEITLFPAFPELGLTLQDLVCRFGGRDINAWNAGRSIKHILQRFIAGIKPYKLYPCMWILLYYRIKFGLPFHCLPSFHCLSPSPSDERWIVEICLIWNWAPERHGEERNLSWTVVIFYLIFVKIGSTKVR